MLIAWNLLKNDTKSYYYLHDSSFKYINNEDFLYNNINLSFFESDNKLSVDTNNYIEQNYFLIVSDSFNRETKFNEYVLKLLKNKIMLKFISEFYSISVLEYVYQYLFLKQFFFFNILPSLKFESFKTSIHLFALKYFYNMKFSNYFRNLTHVYALKSLTDTINYAEDLDSNYLCINIIEDFFFLITL